MIPQYVINTFALIGFVGMVFVFSWIFILSFGLRLRRYFLERSIDNAEWARYETKRFLERERCLKSKTLKN